MKLVVYETSLARNLQYDIENISKVNIFVESTLHLTIEIRRIKNGKRELFLF